MDLMQLLTGAQPGPTTPQTAALRGVPDPSQQTGTPVGPYQNPINGAPSSSPGSPGISGAILDAVAALAKAFAPKALSQRGQKVDQAVDRASGGPSGTQTGALGDQF